MGFLGARHELRTLLQICALLMIVTGIAIPNLSHLVFIAMIAFIGTMNPTTGDIGVHVPLEQAALAENASDDERTRILARYSLIGALSIAAGALAAAAPDFLVSFGMSKLAALQTMFYVYAALGLFGAGFYSYMPGPKQNRTSSEPTALGPSRKTVYSVASRH
jgi:MFS family permease